MNIRFYPEEDSNMPEQLCDNYLNPIVERIFHDEYTSYELVNNQMPGYYVNTVYNPNKPNQKRVIIAKFEESSLNQNANFYFAMIFWEALKIKNLK